VTRKLEKDFWGHFPSHYTRALRRAEKLFGPKIGWGRHRTVFRDGAEVVKVPSRSSGCCANDEEARTWKTPHEPRAKCRFDPILSEKLGVPVLRMEYVEHVGWSERADWTWSVDCGQVGHTADGRLVAYDWEHAR